MSTQNRNVPLTVHAGEADEQGVLTRTQRERDRLVTPPSAAGHRRDRLNVWSRTRRQVRADGSQLGGALRRSELASGVVAPPAWRRSWPGWLLFNPSRPLPPPEVRLGRGSDRPRDCLAQYQKGIPGNLRKSYSVRPDKERFPTDSIELQAWPSGCISGRVRSGRN